MASRTQNIDIDFAFFVHLQRFYADNKGTIRRNYRELTKRFLDFNDPENGKRFLDFNDPERTKRSRRLFLRVPQFEALEMYVFLKEYLDNRHIHEIFQEWAERKGRFTDRAAASQSAQQLGFFEEYTREQFDAVFRDMQKFRSVYPNYIFALTMGTGKTILMATCIFYEFILANKFPKDEKYCHNALVFAPDTTVLQSLREIQTMEMQDVVPPEYVNFLSSNIKFHFLDDAGTSLDTLDKSRFNLVISNTQKIILKRQHKERSAADLFFNSGRPTYEPGSVYDEFSDLYESDTPETEADLTTNQRFEKLRRLEQLGIYIDEAHHAFGNQLERDMGIRRTKTSLRVTIDELAASLNAAGTHVVACYNYTGTPYVKNRILPQVVYAYGLKDAIAAQYLKRVRIHGYTNPRSKEFVGVAIADFLRKTSDLRPEGMLPKLAFFASTIEELQSELRPAVEAALIKHGVPLSRILVNVGDDKLTSNDDIREFNRLDTPHSDKQFILLVNKGREGWNCRSLFGVALFRKPNSRIFVLQATMRCLRAIGDAQQTGEVYLSEENREILNDELQQNFRVSVEDVTGTGSDSAPVKVKVRQPPVTLKLKRVRRQYAIEEKAIVDGIDLALEGVDTQRYRLLHTQQEGLPVDGRGARTYTEDISFIREQRRFTRLTLVAEIARYLNKPCLFIEDTLAATVQGIDGIVAAVNEFNELLYDVVIPRLFGELYDITETDDSVEYEVELVKQPDNGYYEVTGKVDKTVTLDSATAREAAHVAKSFHLDTYCFDSGPEHELFWCLLRDGRVKHIYFTGMLTHGQSEFYIQYIDPESHALRSYYPDFLIEQEDGSYLILEVKGDNKIDDPVVQAKKDFAQQMAVVNGMRYEMIAGSDAENCRYGFVFGGSGGDGARQVVL